MRKIILIFSIFLFVINSSYAKTVLHLKSGKTVEGDLLEKTEEYIKISFLGTALTYWMDDIESVESDTEAQAIADSSTAGTLDKENIIEITRDDLSTAGFDVSNIQEGEAEEGLYIIFLQGSEGYLLMKRYINNIEVLKGMVEGESPVKITKNEGVYGDISYTGRNQAENEYYYDVLQGGSLFTIIYSEGNESKVLSLLDRKFHKK